MERATGKAQCITCSKERSAVRCEGCLQLFCRNHLNDHCQELSQQLDEIEVNRDLFRQKLTQQTTDLQKHPLIKQIDQWENDSIRTIQQTAVECRQLLLQYTTEHVNHIETNLVKLTDQLRQTRQENDFNEIDLKQFKQKLTQFEKELDQLPTVSFQQSSATLINKISVFVSKERLVPSPHISFNEKWRQNAITIAGGNGQGSRLNQFCGPQSMYVYDDEYIYVDHDNECIYPDDDHKCIYIADFLGHRIVKWKYNANVGQVVAGGHEAGNRTDQLKHPTAVVVDERNDSLLICDWGNKRIVQWPRRNGTNGKTIISDINCCDLTLDKNGDLYVADYAKHEVRRWKRGETNGSIVAGGNGQGAHLNQLGHPACIFVDQDYSVYVSDRDNHRVTKWVQNAKEGIVVAGGQGQGNSLTQLFKPQGVLVDKLGHVYVADFGNHRIMRWSNGYEKGAIVVGGNGQGHQSNQFNCPSDLSFDRQSNLYVVDYNNHRVQKFQVDSN